jgi:hypothetical protein
MTARAPAPYGPAQPPAGSPDGPAPPLIKIGVRDEPLK